MRGQLNIRIDDGRKVRWSEAAMRQGLDLSEWIRQVCDEAALNSEQGALFEAPPAVPVGGQRGATWEP